MWWVPPVLTLTVAAVAPVAVSAGLVPVRSHVSDATVALVLAALVALLAAIGTRLGAAVAALSAALSFDIGFTRPYGSFSISRAQDIETTGLLLVVGLIVGQLAARNRRHRGLVEEASYDLGRIHAVAEMVAAGAPADEVVLAVADELKELLGLRACSFATAVPEKAGPRIESNGAVSWGALRWGFTTMGLPSKEVTLVVKRQGLPLGRYTLLAAPGSRVSSDQLRAAVALADQAGAALAIHARSA